MTAHINVLRSEVAVGVLPGVRISIFRSEVTNASSSANIKIYRSEVGTPSSVTASASPTGTVEPFTVVTLVGGGGDSAFTTQTWTQLSGTPVTITQSGDTATFIAPGTYAGDAPVFQYAVDGVTAKVTVPVYPATEFAIIGGVQVPMQMQLVSST